MKFPLNHGGGRTPADEKAPDVTSDVLGRLGLPAAESHKPRSAPIGFLRGARRIRFVAFLGMIILGSILWRGLASTDDSFVLVENVPRTIENGRESRAQLFMGFMSPFEEIGRAITEVDEIRTPGLGIESDGAYHSDQDDPGSENQGSGMPTSVDILEASAPFPNS